MSQAIQTENAGIYDEMDYSAEYSDNLPAILKQLNISLAFTSYQAARLMLVRSDGETLDINYKSFPRPMGLTVTQDSLTLGTFTQVIKFQREDLLLSQVKQPLPTIEEDITAPRIKPKEPEQPVSGNDADAGLKAEASEPDVELTQEQLERRKQWQAYQKALFAPLDERADACFISRSAHFTGMINIHDIDWGDEGLWAVNSSFSCLCTLSPDASFIPRWKPHFISELGPEDRCHLNGMALKDGKPAYVTTFSQYNEPAKWRHSDEFNGTLMEVAGNRILLEGLAMPHSPRWHQGKVYFCNSGYGELCSYDPASGRHETIAKLPGFTRGMDFYGPLLFVGLSKVRDGAVNKPSPLKEMYPETFSGIWIINLEDSSQVAHISFTGNVDQIYDIAVLTDCSFPELIEPQHPRMRNHFCFPALTESRDR
ncbi:TIGR03032 family protein [Shewanella salipaludis]|uniref:TIGR03032 family protein n=1 Tax=Shewanella salipaludis TaxID=2723052 RepID=A0A972G6J3_9GAMM|nr:TIGR03032 family protein [Shewanella salipaludis]NMH65415.1 TIGR03032 family protein [Shewanella salipaludis]